MGLSYVSAFHLLGGGVVSHRLMASVRFFHFAVSKLAQSQRGPAGLWPIGSQSHTWLTVEWVCRSPVPKQVLA